VALTVLALSINTVQVLLVPVQSPLQPVNFRNMNGDAVNVTIDPEANDALAELQEVPQLIPEGELLTAPLLELVLVTERV
jgi:hypothetical protein